MTALPLTLHPLVASLEMEPVRLEPGSGPRTIGRHSADDRSDDDLHIPDPTVSRPHARLEPGDRGWSLVNLEPKNGTYVNLMPLAPNESTPLPSGVIVEFGAIAFAAVLGDEDDPIPAFESPRAMSAGNADDEDEAGLVGAPDAAELATVTLHEWRTRIADFAAVDHADEAVRGLAEGRVAERCMLLAARYARSACARTGATREQAEDATHDAVMKLLGAFRRKGGHYFDPARGSFRALFRTIFVRELIRRLGREAREAAVDPAALPLAYQDREIIRVVIEDELRDVLRRLRKMEKNERRWQAFELHVLKGQPGPAVMEQLGIDKPGTFYSMITRVRTKALEIHEDGSFID